MMDDSGHSQHDRNRKTVEYTCPMHPEVRSSSPGNCSKCGMRLVPVKMKEGEMTGHERGHVMKPASQMSRWEKFRMSMTMTMGMEHTGVAGREMARLMELDIRQKFFFATGRDSPVTRDSSIAVSPSTIVPSTGTRSPGFRTMMSPTSNSEVETRISLPSLTTLACGGTSWSNACKASVVPRRDLISIQ